MIRRRRLLLWGSILLTSHHPQHDECFGRCIDGDVIAVFRCRLLPLFWIHYRVWMFRQNDRRVLLRFQRRRRRHHHLSGGNSNVAMAAAATRSLPIPVSRSYPLPEYNFADEENLPSLFLKREMGANAATASLSISLNPSTVSNSSSNGLKAPQSTDGGPGPGSSSSSVKRQGSGGLLLRAVAAANNTRRGTLSSSLLTSLAAPNGNSIGMESDG